LVLALRIVSRTSGGETAARNEMSSTTTGRLAAVIWCQLEAFS
jgi:hypothetical protein